MKRTLLFVFTTLTSLGILAQEEKEVITGTSYANDVYYSLENGTVTTVQRDNWDIGFFAFYYSAGIMANNGSGVELYTYPDGSIDDWETLDTTGMNWDPMYNSLESFEDGAFNAHAGEHPDYGWGIFTMGGQYPIDGDSLFVIKTISGAYKKLAIIQKLAAVNTWEFKFANLDGSDEQSVFLDASMYQDKNFVYYSIDSLKVLDREPAKTDWDLLFTKYYDYTIPYSVAGVLINDDHVVAQEVRESGMDQSAHNSYQDTSFSSSISTIGSDWKQFNRGTMSYDIVDTVVYYLKTYEAGDSTYYKLYFTDFTSGMEDGKYTFMQEEIWMVSAADNELPDRFLQVYPNPARDNIQVVFDLYGRADIEIVDMTGRLVHSRDYEASGFTSLSLDLGMLNPGIFFVRVSSGNRSDVLRFIKE